MATMNNIKTELCDLKYKAIEIVRAHIEKSRSREYAWIIVGGRRLIFQKANMCTANPRIIVWHNMKGDVRGPEVELTVDEWVEAAAKCQHKVVVEEKQVLYLDGQKVGFGSVTRKDQLRSCNGYLNYDLTRNLQLERGRKYELSMKVEKVVKTEAEAEVDAFFKVLEEAGHNLKAAEESWQIACEFHPNKEGWCWMRELDVTEQ